MGFKNIGPCLWERANDDSPWLIRHRLVVEKYLCPLGRFREPWAGTEDFSASIKDVGTEFLLRAINFL